MKRRSPLPSSARSTRSILPLSSMAFGPCRTACMIPWRASASPARCWVHLRRSRCCWPPWASTASCRIWSHRAPTISAFCVALGARRENILALVVRQGMQLTLIGIFAGLIGAAALTRVIASLLFGVSTTDARHVPGRSRLVSCCRIRCHGHPSLASHQCGPNGSLARGIAIRSVAWDNGKKNCPGNCPLHSSARCPVSLQTRDDWRAPLHAPISPI